jgi:hypothetical protein
MSEEFKKIVDSSFDKGTPLWIYTSDYIFGMVPADPNGARWTEVAFAFQDEEPLVKNERNADLSFQFLFEELEKGVSFYVEDFHVNNLKVFAKTIEGKPGPEKIKALITELTNNSKNYSSNLPIVKNKSELGILKQKL